MCRIQCLFNDDREYVTEDNYLCYSQPPVVKKTVICFISREFKQTAFATHIFEFSSSHVHVTISSKLRTFRNHISGSILSISLVRFNDQNLSKYPSTC